MHPDPDTDRQNGKETKQNPPEIGGQAGHTFLTWSVSLGLLAVLTLVALRKALFASGGLLLSTLDADLALQFVHWRAFGFGELRHGHLALWNPHLFSGTPFLGGFQSALLYPPNMLFLLLPLAEAVNWSIALHVFLAGAFTYAWVAKRGLQPPACFLAGVIFMFSGPYYLHIYPGHLSNLCTMIWTPLLFLAIDGLFEAPRLGWSLLGMFAVAMQVLAGHPQYVYYTGMAAGVYCYLCLFETRRKWPFALGLAGIVAGAAGLSAVQLFTSMGESTEMLRGAGVSYNFAILASFPPENFMTMLAPDFFGNMKTVAYWGQQNLWEMSLFIGVAGLVFAIMGGIWGNRSTRRFSVLMAAMPLLLAVGNRTLIFDLCYWSVPGFNQFRGSSKFIFLTALFLAMLAGIGLNELLKGRKPARSVIVWLSIGFLLFTTAAWVWPRALNPRAEHWWRSIVFAAHRAPENITPARVYRNWDFSWQVGQLASRSLMTGGVIMMSAGLLLWWARRRRLAVWLLLALAVAELFAVANRTLDYFQPESLYDPVVRECLKNNSGDYRIEDSITPNHALSLNAKDVWGYDPGILRRYAQVIALTQGTDPDAVNQDISLYCYHPLFEMLRLRFVFGHHHDGPTTVREYTNTLPQLLLVQRCQVLEKRSEIFDALTNASFNPREQVILETAPEPRPVPAGDPGSVKLIRSSTDSLVIEAAVPSPAILLVTDTYAKGWRARALPGSAQTDYRVMPANWCLRAVPLAAGHHLLCLEYAPIGFRVGKWVSMASAFVFLALIAVNARWLGPILNNK
jgi:hypothetical protein